MASSLKKMLELEEEYRIDFVKLKSLIPPYEQVQHFFNKVEEGEAEIEEEPMPEIEEIKPVKNTYRSLKSE